MTKSLADIMANKWDEPPEIKAIKSYIKDTFQSNVAVAINNNQIAINVQSSALAGMLRMHILDLQKAAKTDKKLVIRIG